jgi:hypothetical protein
MNAQQLSQWFENIEANKENWFHSCTFKLKKDSKEFSCKDLTWEQFTNCWIQTTASKLKEYFLKYCIIYFISVRFNWKYTKSFP